MIPIKGSINKKRLGLSNYFSVISKILDTLSAWLKKFSCLSSSSKRYTLGTGVANLGKIDFLFSRHKRAFAPP